MNIAVYCSSSNHIPQKYISTAFELGKWIAKSGNVLIFGGATGGLMDAVSEGVSSEKGKIIGVIPQAVVRMNRQSPLCTELIQVDTMSERKLKMKEFADIFVVLPGSYGTLDEMFDVVASGIVGEHKKPLILINQYGFYNSMMQLIQNMLAEGFIPTSHQNYKPEIVESIEDCIKSIILKGKKNNSITQL